MAGKTKSKFFSIATLVKSAQIFSAILLLYAGTASAMVLWPRALPFEPFEFASADQSAPAPSGRADSFQMRDGAILSASRFGPESNKVVLMLHGVASDQAMMSVPAQMLSAASGMEVITLDLRGHGGSAGDRFDVDYIGQYEDDIEDVMEHLLAESDDRQVVLAGHSMGGGVAMRYALKESAPKPAAYLLIAPNFGEGPTEKKHAPKTEAPQYDGPSPIHFDLPRMIGQIMLNTIGVTALDHKPVLYFNFPPAVKAYSYRAVMSGQPIRPLTTDKALRAVDAPLLVVIGEDDEVFYAKGYEGFVSAHSEGQTHLIKGASHTSVLFDETGYALVAQWLSDVGLLTANEVKHVTHD